MCFCLVLTYFISTPQPVGLYPRHITKSLGHFEYCHGWCICRKLNCVTFGICWSATPNISQNILYLSEIVSSVFVQNRPQDGTLCAKDFCFFRVRILFSIVCFSAMFPKEISFSLRCLWNFIWQKCIRLVTSFYQLISSVSKRVLETAFELAFFWF